MNNENHAENFGKQPFDFRKVEKELEERKVIQGVKKKAAEKGKVIDPLAEEILRLQGKRKKIAENSSLSLEAPALIEQLDAQIQRLKNARRAGGRKKEEK